MPFDSGLIGAIHVERLARADAAGDAAMPHVVFQTSTIDALLDGAYEGDLTLGELRAHGDLGLGTVQKLDGELIVLDGRFYRADASGRLNELALETRTPFAVVVPFAPEATTELRGPVGLAGLYARLDELAPPDGRCVAVRLEGSFRYLKLRSVARQEPPYRPLAVALEDQVVHELRETAGTVVGFRFPRAAQGIEVAGYHLHFVSKDRIRGGHVLDLKGATGRLAVDSSSELHLELPAGVRLGSADPSRAKRELLERLEGGVARSE